MIRLLCVLTLALAVPVAHADPSSVIEQLQARLGERTAEVEKLKQEGDRLKQDVSRLQGELAAARAVRSATSDAPPPPAPTHDTVFLREPERQRAVAWPLLIGSCALMLLTGFVAGWRTLDRRIRRKYGGLKIY